MLRISCVQRHPRNQRSSFRPERGNETKEFLLVHHWLEARKAVLSAIRGRGEARFWSVDKRGSVSDIKARVTFESRSRLVLRPTFPAIALIVQVPATPRELKIVQAVTRRTGSI